METLVLKAETDRFESPALQVGERALWAAGVFTKELGVNDPLTHLEQYLVQGEEAIAAIDEDLITDIAERRLKPTFVNSVKFDRAEGDFISRENKFSMRQMTAITEQKFTGNIANLELNERAKIESQEVNRLNRWFDSAEINDVFIVESIGLTPAEKYTIVRIHQKTGQDELTEHVMPLHNASVDIFNRLHNVLGAQTPNSQTPLELLDNMYTHRPYTENIVEEYVSSYDGILADENPGRGYNFGLPKTEKLNVEDDIESIRLQTALRSVYLDTLRTLKKSGGYVTPEVIATSHNLGCSFRMFEDDKISFEIARELLDYSLQSVVATFNQAPKQHLDALAVSQDKSAAAEYAGHYGGEARAEGIRYDGACPSGSVAAVNAEAAALALGHRFNKHPSQCGTCPKCNKEYYVPDKIYKNKILHCNNCKASIHFDGSSVDSKSIDDFYGNKRQESGLFTTESFSEYWARLGREQELKKAKKQVTRG